MNNIKIEVVKYTQLETKKLDKLIDPKDEVAGIKPIIISQAMGKGGVR